MPDARFFGTNSILYPQEADDSIRAALDAEPAGQEGPGAPGVEFTRDADAAFGRPIQLPVEQYIGQRAQVLSGAKGAPVSDGEFLENGIVDPGFFGPSLPDLRG